MYVVNVFVCCFLYLFRFFFFKAICNIEVSCETFISYINLFSSKRIRTESEIGMNISNISLFCTCIAPNSSVHIESRTGSLTQFMPCVGGCPTDVGGFTYVT